MKHKAKLFWARARRLKMRNTVQVLIVSADPVKHGDAGKIVRGMGLCPVTCSSLRDARDLTSREKFKFVLCDDELPDGKIAATVRALTYSTGGAPIVVLSHLADWGAYAKALNAGAFDYIVYPFDRIETERILRRALEQKIVPPSGSGTASRSACSSFGL
jgi:two-component system nitrogen regulation response regulator GlnG